MSWKYVEGFEIMEYLINKCVKEIELLGICIFYNMVL